MVSNHFPNVAIVILNWNGRKFLEQFLPGVLAQSAGAQVIVADNASTDDSVSFLENYFPEVKLIHHKQNLGFCEGYNTALKLVEAEFYVLLNSDVEVTPNWIAPILQLLSGDVSIAACQPKIKSFFDRAYFEYAGAGGGLIDFLGYPFCRGRVFETLEKDNGQYNDIQPVFWATGACMFVRAKAFWELGGLEPAFFAHMEEIDLCWRLQNAGYKVMYCGHSEIYHVGGGTLHKSNSRKTYLNFRNGLALFYKNSSDPNLYFLLLIRIILDWIAALKFTSEGQWRDGLAVFKAHWHLVKNRKYWYKQRQLSPKTSNQPAQIIYNKSVVWQYFIKGKRFYKSLEVPDSATLPS
ncbi:glycosyltransferase family 2 protein [Adhaeribacter aquaticus]|uniref:glycosyltransferase family 2 protein n=1 Tax=Adhaeribacter aquaticus TaxID=299567 RepID=UPI00041C3EE2|nr:glycosyltransferase family 2 protein [Adhaeribacter aquaticus]